MGDSQRDAPRALLHTVAKLHYVSDLSQVDIARRLGLSSATVSRLLRRARAEGIVRIEVRDLEAPDALGERLAATLGLRAAVVVDLGETGHLTGLAVPVATLLKQADLHAGSVFAIGWGRAVRAVIEAGLPRVEGIVTVPATGGMLQPAPHFQIGEFVRLAAEQMGGVPRFIHAPYLPSAEARRALVSDATIAEHMALWERVDAALVGIGLPHAADPGRDRLQITRDEQALVHASGDVIRHYFDRDGTLIPWEGEDRLIALSPVQLRAIPWVIGVAVSPLKAAAIRGAARARLVNALVTDVATAQTLLDTAD